MSRLKSRENELHRKKEEELQEKEEKELGKEGGQSI